MLIIELLIDTLTLLALLAISYILACIATKTWENKK